MLPLAVAALLAAAAPVQAITPNCFFNVTMSDNSPLLRYDPPSAWFSLFVNSPIDSWQPGLLGQGLSSHSAFGLNATVNIEYPGSTAWVRGGIANVSDTPVLFEIDGTKQPYPLVNQNVFMSTSNDLPVGAHTAKISLDPTSTNPEAVLIVTYFQNLCGVVAET